MTSLAWEREHKGAIKGSLYNRQMPSLNLKGDTGIIEAGVILTPQPNLNINLGVKGGFGNRKSIEANADIKYDF